MTVYAMKRGHPLKNLVQQTIFRAGEAGLLKKWTSDFAMLLKNRDEYFVKKYTRAPLKLGEIVPVFYVLSVGLAIALLAFVAELLVTVFHRRVFASNIDSDTDSEERRETKGG